MANWQHDSVSLRIFFIRTTIQFTLLFFLFLMSRPFRFCSHLTFDPSEINKVLRGKNYLLSMFWACYNAVVVDEQNDTLFWISWHSIKHLSLLFTIFLVRSHFANNRNATIIIVCSFSAHNCLPIPLILSLSLFPSFIITSPPLP